MQVCDRVVKLVLSNNEIGDAGAAAIGLALRCALVSCIGLDLNIDVVMEVALYATSGRP